MIPNAKNIARNYREHAIERQRHEQANTDMLQGYVANQRAQSDTNKREDTYDVRRRMRELEILAREEAMETMTRTAMLETRRKQREREQEEALVLELERQKREEDSRRKEIQLICENDPGLRELQAKLTQAYINKERSVQLVEREQIKQKLKAEEIAIAAAMEELRINGSAKDIEAAEKAKVAAEERKRVLQQQLEERQLREFLESEQEAARERGMVDSILSKIRAEDEAEAASKARARAETIAMISEFKAQRDRAVAAQKAAEKEEQRKIAEYLASQSKREEEAKKGRAEEMALREAQYKAIVAEQEALRRQQEEEDQLRWLLVEEEAERRRREDERKQREQVEKAKRDMREANAAAAAIKEKLMEGEREKEQRLIQQFLAKCAEDDRKDALAQVAREEARMRYRAEVAAQAALKQQLFEEQKVASLQEAEEARRKEEFRRRVVEEARRKLLEEHAVKLRGFLPRGVFMTPADLELLKAFDSDKDGVLSNEEMELAQAAFRAYDPGAAAAGGAVRQAAAKVANSATGREAIAVLHPSAAGGQAVGGGRPAPSSGTSRVSPTGFNGQVQGGQAMDVAARNKAAQNRSSISFA